MPANDETLANLLSLPDCGVETPSERFEQAWKAGRQPKIRDFLPDTSAERFPVLTDLVRLEMKLLAQAGLSIRADSYLRDFPELAGTDLRPAAAAEQTIAHLPGQKSSQDGTVHFRPTPKSNGVVSFYRPPSPPENFEPTLPDASSANPKPDVKPLDGGTVQFAPENGILPPEPADGGTLVFDKEPRHAATDSEGAKTTPNCIGDYELLGELGRGGMGVVYKARHTKLNRIVALKMILSGGYASQGDLTRFLIEAEAVASLQHPNIVQIFDTGQHDGLPYFTLEFIDGGSLTGKVQDAPLPARESAIIVEALSRAMHYAHAKGVVHRDLKPDNVLLAANGTPKITDFGLAKKVEGGSGMTQTGAIMGTPSYMAPEQARGESKEVGPPADIYALGAILYRLMTGRPPFQAASPLETVRQVVNDDPVAPSKLLPRLPRDLETICLKCLQKEPSRRYADADALADDLTRFLKGEPVHARPVQSWERWIKWGRRHPSTAALLFLGLFLGIAGIGYLIHYQIGERRRVETVRTQAADFLLKGKEAMARADWKTAKLQFDRAKEAIGTETALSAPSAEADQLLEIAQSRLRAQEMLTTFSHLRDDALLHAARTIGNGSLDQRKATLRKIEAAMKSVGVVRNSREPLSLPDGFELSQTDEIAAGCYELMLVLAEAIAQRMLGQSEDDHRKQLNEANLVLGRAAELGFPSHPTQAFYLRRARYLEESGRADEAQKERLAAAERKPVSALDHYLVGDERYKEGDIPRAIASFETVLRLDPRHFWARYFLAVCQVRQQHPELAKAHLTACLSQRPDAAARAWIYLMRGYTNGQLAKANPDEYASSEKDFEEALAALKQSGDDDAEYALFNNRGVMRIQNRQFDQGIADLQAAIQLNPRQYHAYVSLATAYQQMQRLDDAAEQIRHAIEAAKILVEAKELDGSSVAALFRNRAQIHLERYQKQARQNGLMIVGNGSSPLVAIAGLPKLFGSLDEPRNAARADLEQAIATLEQSPGAEAIAIAKAHAQLGRLLQMSNKYRDAIRSFDQSIQCRANYADAHRWKAQSLLKLGRNTAAAAEFTAYLETCARLGTRPAVDAFLARGLTREKLGDFETAAEDYTRALALDPSDDNGSTYAQRGRAYLAWNRPDLALLDYDAAIQRKVESGELLVARGFAHARLGRFANALTEVEDGLQRGPKTASLAHLSARTYALAAGLDNEPGPMQSEKSTAYRKRTLDLLDEALNLAAPKQGAFWRSAIRLDTSLGIVRRSDRFAQMEQKYAAIMLADAERATRPGMIPIDELLDAARTYAQVADHPAPDDLQPKKSAEELRNQAIDLIRLAISSLPPSDRRLLWQDSIERDREFDSLHQVSTYTALQESLMKSP